MRLSALDLVRYGRFADTRLEFPRLDADFQIVFGPNEAGKSTTMAAIGDLLFGFPHSTPFDFRFDKPLLRVGGHLSAEGVDLVCVRKKGRSGDLMDAEGRALDETQLTRMLAGYGAEGFQRMFSLDHGRLREGGQAILEARDDIGQAIFAAGAGLVGINKLVEALEADSKRIWTRRAGSERLYHIAQKAHDEARARQRKAQVRPAAWEEARKEVERLDGELETLRRRRGELSRQRETVERRRRVLPHAALHRVAQAELAALADAPDLPADAGEIIDEVGAALAGADAETALARGDLARTVEALGEVAADPRVTERAARIEALRAMKGAADKGLRDLPRLRAEVLAPQARLEALRLELGWPGENPRATEARLPRRVAVADLRALLETRSALDATLTGVIADEAAARQALSLLAAAAADLPPARDLGDLAAALKAARGLGDIDADLRVARREAERRGEAVDRALARLAPWSGGADALEAMRPPSEPEIAQAVIGLNGDERALAEADRDARAAEARGAELELQRRQLSRDDRAVAWAAVEAARRERDGLWRRLRGQLLGEHALDDPGGDAAEFVERLAAADSLADRRFLAAELSARLTTLQEDVERAALALDQGARRRTEAADRLEAARAAWLARIRPCGLDLLPAALAAWTEQRRRALEAVRERTEARDRLADIEARARGARETLTAALAALGARLDPGASWAQALREAERLEAAGAADAQRRRELALRADAANTALSGAMAKRVAAERALEDWRGRWGPAVAAAGLSAADSPAVIRQRLALIDELRSAVDEVLKLGQRIAGIERDLAEFDAEVAALAGACGLATEGVSTAALTAALSAAGREAAAALQRRQTLFEQRDAAEGRLAAAAAARARALARLRPLIEIAGTEEPARLAEAARRSRRAQGLRAERDRLAGEILKAGAGPDFETLMADCEGADDADLVVQARDLGEEIDAIAEAIARLSGDRAAAWGDFSRIDHGPDAAIAAADAEQAKAEMAAQAEAYVRKRAEAALLRWAIARYRAEKQAPLLARAAALFRRLTLGHFVDLLVDTDGERARLVGLADDQSVTPPEGMSEGTRDQLFLALRLAAVEDAVAGGARLPFLADDLFINYDDERAVAGLRVLSELAQRTQVLFFTHHRHLVSLARSALEAAPAIRELA
jgi:uncharacterized protein YhaN